MEHKFILPLKLQLFADEVDSNVSEQVATAQDTTPETSEVATEQVAEEVANPQMEVEKPVQSKEDNARFAAARRKAESENQRLLQALEGFGYKGSPQEIADILEAQQTQKPIEQVRAERKAQEQQTARELQTQQELEHYRNIAMQSMVEKGIEKINKAHPEANIKSITDLGQEFIDLISANVDEVMAYEVIQARKARTEIPKPQATGAVNSQTVQEKETYTADEVRQMSSVEVSKNFEKIQKSMKTWKK